MYGINLGIMLSYISQILPSWIAQEALPDRKPTWFPILNKVAVLKSANTSVKTTLWY